MAQPFNDGDHVVMGKTVHGKAVKGAKGVIVRDGAYGSGTVSVRFQGTNSIVSGIPQQYVKKQFPDSPEVVQQDDVEVPTYNATMSDAGLINWLDLMRMNIRGEKWRYYTPATKQHVVAFLQAVSTSNRRPDILHMADEALLALDEKKAGGKMVGLYERVKNIRFRLETGVFWYQSQVLRDADKDVLRSCNLNTGASVAFTKLAAAILNQIVEHERHVESLRVGDRVQVLFQVSETVPKGKLGTILSIFSDETVIVCVNRDTMPSNHVVRKLLLERVEPLD